MQGLLVRVGIDATYGKWNAPVDTRTKRFMFVPIPDCSYNPTGSYVEGGKRTYEEVLPELERFARESDRADGKNFELPEILEKSVMHLDPDFRYLTYGDSVPRSQKLRQFGEDDFVAFYAGLQPMEGDKLVYALIGLFVLDGKPIDAVTIEGTRRLQNAHSRWETCKKDDIVVRGKSAESGLFETCIPIGEWRRNSYRVCESLLSEWGGLSVKDGWIQRSVKPPEFECPEKFRDWLKKKSPQLHRAQFRADVPKMC